MDNLGGLMNKLLLTVAFIFSLNIAAIASDQKPLFKSEGMRVISGAFDSEEINHINVVLNKVNGREKPTSILVQFSVLTSGTNYSKTMKIDSIRKEVCGSTEYIAKNDDINLYDEKIVIFDNRERVCKDFRPYQWEVTVISKALGNGVDLSDEVVFGGWVVPANE